jgi:poly-gamma-glutamate capsule biosynthesis protein CapA/YwtB (metallophosphatase superfamily)
MTELSTGEEARADSVVGLLGDVYVGGKRIASPFEQIDLASADVWFANLEAPLTSATDESRQVRPWDSMSGFKIAPDLVSQFAGISAFSVANNHALDFGVEAYLECIDILDGAGFAHAGGGRNEEEARAPAIVTAGNRRVALLAYTCLFQDGWRAGAHRAGMAAIKVHTSYEAPLRVFEQPGYPPLVHTQVDPGDLAKVCSEVTASKAQAESVIVSVHWGLSVGNREVMEYQEALGIALIEAGADAVFGHHPHALQPLVLHEGKPIFLSLGNILFDYEKAWRGSNVTAAVRLHFGDQRLSHLTILPLVRDENGNPARCGQEKCEEVAALLFPRTRPDVDYSIQDGKYEVRFEVKE